MNRTGKSSRKILSAGAALAAGAIIPGKIQSETKAKNPGETKIVAIMGGDRGHNAIPLEYHIRSLFAPHKNWRFIFVLSSRFFTPELISDADLLITSRHSRPDDIDWRTEGLAESIETGAQLWTDENADAVIDNVRNRGMGFMALHNSIFCGNDKIVDLLGVEPIMHNEIQPLWLRDFNGDHPVSNGIGDFMIKLDEQFGVVIKSEHTISLFGTTAMHDKRDAVGGWCRENGKGRVVGLLPGHHRWAYLSTGYREILWRAAHWAMKKEIPDFSEKV